MSVPLGHLLSLRLGRTAQQVLDLTLNPLLAGPQVTDGLVEAINHNQAFHHFLQKIDALQGRGEQWGAGEASGKDGAVPQISAQSIVGLLGKSATRNSILSLRLNRLRNEGLTRKNKDKLAMTPREQIRFALFLEEFCQDNYLAFPEMAFKAGLHYDWLWGLIEKDKEVPKEAKAYFDEVWADSVVIAQIAYGLGGQIKNLAHQEYLFAAGILVSIGKIFMVMNFGKDGKTPTWKDFNASLDKYEERRTQAQILFEKKKYPVTHSQYSALFMAFFGLLFLGEKAVCFYQEPFYLKFLPKDKTWYPLACILNLSVHIQGFHKNGKTPNFLGAQRKYLNELAINEKNVTYLLKKVKPYKK